MQKPHLSEKRQWCPFPIISPLTPHTRARAMSAPTGDAKRVYKLSLGGDARETGARGGGRDARGDGGRIEHGRGVGDIHREFDARDG